MTEKLVKVRLRHGYFPDDESAQRAVKDGGSLTTLGKIVPDSQPPGGLRLPVGEARRLVESGAAEAWDPFPEGGE